MRRLLSRASEHSAASVRALVSLPHVRTQATAQCCRRLQVKWLGLGLGSSGHSPASQCTATPTHLMFRPCHPNSPPLPPLYLLTPLNHVHSLSPQVPPLPRLDHRFPSRISAASGLTAHCNLYKRAAGLNWGPYLKMESGSRIRSSFDLGVTANTTRASATAAAQLLVPRLSG